MYTENFIKNNWLFKKYWFNYLAVSDKDANIDFILHNVFKFISTYASNPEYLYAVNEDALSKLLNKFKKKDTVNSAEYVANAVKYTNKSKADESFYDKSTVIKITNDNGEVVDGIIRISTHDVDLQKWSEMNNTFDFGISFVFNDSTNEWQGNEIVTNNNRTICIYEYDFNVNGTNRQFLDVIISQILGIKKTKTYLAGQNIKGVVPLKKISKLQEKLINAISNALQFLKNE